MKPRTFSFSLPCFAYPLLVMLCSLVLPRCAR